MVAGESRRVGAGANPYRVRNARLEKRNLRLGETVPEIGGG
jgi:hypothetical protein